MSLLYTHACAHMRVQYNMHLKIEMYTAFNPQVAQ